LAAEVAVQMTFGRWLLVGVLAGGAVAFGLAPAKSPARPALVLVLVLFALPIAIGGLLRGFDPLVRAVLAVSSSLVFLTLTATLMAVSGFWSPTGGLLAVAGLTVVCLMAQWPPIARRLKAAAGAIDDAAKPDPSENGNSSILGDVPLGPKSSS
jgi:hypothetical protein